MAVVDVVTVFHREENYRLAITLNDVLVSEPEELEFEFFGVDNREDNRGFAKACNLGAREGSSPFIAFLNPDVKIHGPVLADGIAPLVASPRVVIAGDDFGKERSMTYGHWGCEDWVCGAAMFVQRWWFEQVGGFDEDFVWGWEETDLIRRAQAGGYASKSVKLSASHGGWRDDEEDSAYKKANLKRGSKIFYRRWGGEL
jgi:GT2 family glycosyltransferase